MSRGAATGAVPPPALRVVPAGASRAAPAEQAWLLPGAGPAAWLAALADADPEVLAEARVIVLPRGRDDARPAAALLYGAPGLPAHPQRQAWQVRARRVFLPVDARLDPPVDDDELLALLVHDLLVLHPALGAVGAGHGETMAVTALLAPPGSEGPRWDRARPAPPSPGIAGLAGVVSGDADAIARRGRDDIGSRDPGELAPPGPGILDTAAGMAFKGLGMAGGALARGLGALGGMMGGSGAADGGMLGRLASWSAAAAAAAAERLMPRRLAAIEQLLDLLARDPERGLRHALPMGDGGAPRGVAQPGAQLGTHGLDFDLGRLGGGGAADVWDLPYALRQRLGERYRELARQELASGHHRRAAYIYAHLLGDLEAAARALEAGKHHREAAVLWRDRLKRPQEAALCLERGGLWDEAIVIHEQLGHHRAAGDCHMRLGRSEQARACWRRAALELVAGDPLGAAALYEDPLHEPDAALAVLAAAWPHHAQAARCLAARFDLLGRLGRHVQAGALVADLVAAGARAPAVVEILAGLVAGYPDPALRAQAADAGRVMIGNRLAAGDAGGALLRLLPRLDADDRLLARDAQRYVPPPAAPAAQRLALDAGVHWRTAVAVDNGLLAAGLALVAGRMRLTVARLGWNGTAQYVHWNLTPAEAADAPERVRLIPLGRRVLVFAPWPSAGRELPPADGLPERLYLEGLRGDLGQGSLLMAMDEVNAASLLVSEHGQLMLRARSPAGVRVAVLPLEPRAPYALALLDRLVAVVADGCLLGLAWPPDPSWNPTPVEAGFPGALADEMPGLRLAMLDHPALDTAVAPDGGSIAIAHVDGVTAHAPVKDGWKLVRCAQGMARPAIGYSRNGVLVVADQGELRRYRCAPPAVALIESRRWEPGAVPILVVPHARETQVAVVLENGAVVVV